MKPCIVLPIHPVKGRNLHVDDITPSTGMDELVLVRTVDVFSQSIVIGIVNSPGGRSNPMLGTSLVVDNADILRPVVTMVNQPWKFPWH